MKKLIFLSILIISLIYLLDYTKKRELITTDKLLINELNSTVVIKKINIAIKQNNLTLAKSYLELARELNISIPFENIDQKIENRDKSFDIYIKKSKDFFNGFISGKVNDTYSLTGSIISDFTIIGDIRDIYKEGNRYLHDKPYDNFILSLSIIGLTLSTTTIISFGATAPLKSGISILKSSKKSKILTKSMQKILYKDLEKSINLEILKKMDLSSISSIKKNSYLLKKSINLKPLETTLKNIEKVNKNISTTQTIRVLKYIDNKKELQTLIKISNKYKEGTLATFKTIGKKALRGSKIVIKKTTLFFLTLFSIVISFIVWIAIFITILKKYFLNKFL